MCLLNNDMNLLVLSELIGMIICLYEELLVVILILGLSLSVLLKIVLFNSLIFLSDSSGKISLILRIFLIFLDKIWVYKGLPDFATSLILLWVFLPWNLDFSRTSFEGLGGSWGIKFREVSWLGGRERVSLFFFVGERNFDSELIFDELSERFVIGVCFELIPSTLENSRNKVEDNLAKVFEKQNVFLLIVL